MNLTDNGDKNFVYQLGYDPEIVKNNFIFFSHLLGRDLLAKIFQCSYSTVGRIIDDSSNIKLDYVVKLFSYFDYFKSPDIELLKDLTIEKFITTALPIKEIPELKDLPKFIEKNKKKLAEKEHNIINEVHKTEKDAGYCFNFREFIYQKYIGFDNENNQKSDGRYNVYFLITEDNKEEFIQEGILTISYSEEKVKYIASLEVKVKDRIQHYKGDFWISITSKKAFISLVGCKFSEKISIIFNDPETGHNNYKGGIGVLCTYSSGYSKEPCIQKIVLSKRCLDVSDTEYRRTKDFLKVTNGPIILKESRYVNHAKEIVEDTIFDIDKDSIILEALNEATSVESVKLINEDIFIKNLIERGVLENNHSFNNLYRDPKYKIIVEKIITPLKQKSLSKPESSIKINKNKDVNYYDFIR